MKVKEIELPAEISPEWISKENGSLLATSAGLTVRLNCRQLKRLDSLSLAWFVRLQSNLEKLGGQLILANLSETLQAELAKVSVSEPGQVEALKPLRLTEQVGDTAYKLLEQVRDTLVLLSESLYWSTLAVFRPKTLQRSDIVNQLVRLGSSALPITLLLSGLIGFTLALQSGIQLQKFGATIFLASGIGISMVTEIGPVMTAVIMAGRSGSSITAEISTMVVQEEVGALHAMAINPIHYLVLPRFWAMSLAMPLLTVCASLAGIFAGLAVGMLFFRLSPIAFLSELRGAITLNLIGQALIKSLTFSWIITLVAINRGLNVRGGADAVGKATTSCVVTCIFSIILADAVFSFIFYY